MPEDWWVKRGVETHLVWNQIRNHRALFLSKIWSSKCVKCQVLVLFRELQLPSSTITVWRPAMFSLLYACWNTIVVCSQGYRVQVHPLHYGTPFFFYFGSEHSKYVLVWRCRLLQKFFFLVHVEDTFGVSFHPRLADPTIGSKILSR